MPVRVAFFKSDCRDCGNMFPYPLLPDHETYGTFMAKGPDGRTFAYLCSLIGPGQVGWDEVASIFGKIAAEKNLILDEERDDLQRLVGKCLDSVNGHELSITEGPRCPECGSNNINYGDGELIDSKEIPEASFEQFLSLNPQDRERRIRHLLKEGTGKPDAPG